RDGVADTTLDVPAFKRILLKLSGEAFAGTRLGFGIDAGVVTSLADQLIDVQSLGIEVAVVVGGGNIFRGAQASAMGMERAGADAILKGTRVDGIYDGDPLRDPAAKRFDNLEYLEVLSRGLKVMDSTAISLCMEHALPIIVFDLTQHGNIRRVVLGEPVGTRV